MGQSGCRRGGQASEMVWASCCQGSQVHCLNKATDCHEGSGSGSPLESRCGWGWFRWGSPGETSLSASRGVHSLQPLPHITPTSRPLFDSPTSFPKDPVVSCPSPRESRAAFHRSILHQITPASSFGPGELTRQVSRVYDWTLWRPLLSPSWRRWSVERGRHRAAWGASREKGNFHRGGESAGDGSRARPRKTRELWTEGRAARRGTSIPACGGRGGVDGRREAA